MSAEAKLREILVASAPVVAVVGEKIYNKFVPQDVDVPAISYTRESTSYIRTIHGFDIEETATFEIYCVDTSDDGAEALGDLVDAIFVPPPKNMAKINRSAMYDSETQLHAAVITVNVDP